MEKFAKAVCEDVAAKFGFTPTYRWKDKDTLLICDIDGTPINEIHVDALQ